jgi:hypothetical protein
MNTSIDLNTCKELLSIYMRRHLNKGQQAMAMAMLYPDTKPGKKRATSSETEKVSATRLSIARAVLHASRKMAELEKRL